MNNKSENCAFDNGFGHNVIVIGETLAGKTFLMSELALPMKEVNGEAKKSSCRVNNKGLNDGN